MNLYTIAFLLIASITCSAETPKSTVDAWCGRIVYARLLETNMVISPSPDNEKWPTVDHVLVDLSKEWNTLSKNEKQRIILVTIVYSNIEGGTLQMFDQMIGLDSDKALESLAPIDVKLLAERFGINKETAIRNKAVLERLKKARK